MAPVAALPLLGADGNSSLADYKGKVVVLNVWASWCDPCREEMPLLQKTHEQISSQGGMVLGVDTQDAIEQGARVPEGGRRRRSRACATATASTGASSASTAIPRRSSSTARGGSRRMQRFPVDQAWLDKHLPKLLAEKA